MKFRNFSFPNVPSGILTNIEKKQKYFEGLLQYILDLAKSHEDLRNSILKILYRFIFKGNFYLQS